MSEEKAVAELTEDMEVVGPGQMLAEARKNLGLSAEDVADKLNFRKTLVDDIEQDNFDHSLPSTFNRGYLRNYAKLVNISIEDVLTSYETLNIAQKQGAELQSFSKQTEKQAETNRLMWISYLILAVLIGSTVIWWVQDARMTQSSAPAPGESDISTDSKNSETNLQAEIAVGDKSDSEQPSDTDTVSLSQSLLANPVDSEELDIKATPDVMANQTISNTEIATENQLPSDATVAASNNEEGAVTEKVPSDQELVKEANNLVPVNEDIAQTQETVAQVISAAVFTFSGDCWVNIYDATGERVAWGIKKAGYVMNIKGVAPFSVTLGKPELVSIEFEQQPVDMSSFNRGNIAKFTLPIEDNS